MIKYFSTLELSAVDKKIKMSHFTFFKILIFLSKILINAIHLLYLIYLIFFGEMFLNFKLNFLFLSRVI
jgi:hypothetical protein